MNRVSDRKTTAAIILAAGSSSRMDAGRHKLLLPLGDRPVLAHVLDAVLASQARPVIVVLGHQAEQVRNHIATNDPQFLFVENPDYAKGMSTSLHTGVRTAMQNETIDSIIIVLGDQPLITTQNIDRLISARQTTGKRIIAPLYQGRRGNPILFASSLFAELLETTGDEGGRSVVERHRQDIASVELGDATASYDVDTWEAYQHVLAEWQRKKQALTE